MSLILKALGWTGLPQWALEIGAIALVVGALYLGGVLHEKHVVEVRTIRQQVQVEKRVIETDHSHDQELSDLRAYRAAHPVEPVQLCESAVRATRFPEGSSGPGPAPVQPVPAGDPSGGAGRAGPDIAGMLSALAASADTVSADLRRRQTLEP